MEEVQRTAQRRHQKSRVYRLPRRVSSSVVRDEARCDPDVFTSLEPNLHSSSTLHFGSRARYNNLFSLKTLPLSSHTSYFSYFPRSRQYQQQRALQSSIPTATPHTIRQAYNRTTYTTMSSPYQMDHFTLNRKSEMERESHESPAATGKQIVVPNRASMPRADTVRNLCRIYENNDEGSSGARNGECHPLSPCADHSSQHSSIHESSQSDSRVSKRRRTYRLGERNHCRDST